MNRVVVTQIVNDFLKQKGIAQRKICGFSLYAQGYADAQLPE
jgi:hypothetical protein